MSREPLGSSLNDEAFMALALAQAGAAADAGEVPVGAVVTRNGRVIASGRNRSIASFDPTAHAEIVALRAAANLLGNYRLDDCTLYVTLEPCAMCAGAILHARLPRVVFGATDPKTGAGGSVIDLFQHAKLNHQTQVEGGVLAAECSKLLTDFFQTKRELERAHAVPLREDALRTAEGRFTGLALSTWQANYVADLPSLRGLRMHYLDVGSKDATQVLLCLHSSVSWGYVFYPKLADWISEGKRVIVPDLIGFGKSDKPKRASLHTVAFHQQTLIELLAHLGLDPRTQVLPVLQDDLEGLCSDAVADQAPFADAGYRAAFNAFAGGECRISLITDALRAHGPAG